jgi:8-oxo-dGTP pyrophosphatase MutT (NUDIX family)
MLHNPSELDDLLNKFGVNTGLWGIGEALDVAHLFEEILQGESYLKIDKDGISRVTEIVKMFFCDPNHPERGYLLELGQKLPDERIRERRQHPSGKIKNGESPEEAVIREIKEELQIGRDGYHLTRMPSGFECRPSKAYPELTCYYNIHKFWVTLSPDSPALKETFSTTEENGSTLFFGWENPIADQ